MFKQRLFVGASLALAISFAAGTAVAQHAPAGQGQQAAGEGALVSFEQSSASIPFDLHRGSRVFVNATLNGHSTPIMLDTGASAVGIDRVYARTIGLQSAGKTSVHGAGGAVEAEIVTGVSINLGNVRIDNIRAVVMDLEPIAKALGRPLPVILGRDLFNNSVVGLNWTEQKLTISDPKTFKPAVGAAPLKLGTMGPFRSIPLSVADLPPIDAVLDLGNGGTIALPSDYWTKQPALANLPAAEGSSGGIGGLHTVRRVTLPTVTLAGKTFSAVPATLGSDSRGGHLATSANVGIEMLKAFQVDLDLGRSQIYLKPRMATPDWGRERAGVFVQLEGNRLKVMHVSPQGPASKAGLKAGDEITTVNGHLVDADFYNSPAGGWNRAAAGTVVELMRADGSKVHLTLRDYY